MSATTKRLAVDIGGTFVDAILFDEETGESTVHKASTTPDDPSRGVMDAITGLSDDLSSVGAFVHGTTLGLNAILQRRGASVGVITNEGFADILEIARADVPANRMYDFRFRPKPPLVPRRARRGVPGRVNAQGEVVTPLDVQAVVEAGRVLIEEHQVDALAVCFLHSYVNPTHEQEAVAALCSAYPTMTVAAASDISREYREYERTSTVVLDAYIRPILNDYLVALEREMQQRAFHGSFHVMRSGGGAMTVEIARRAPLTTVLSGPAGGVAGAAHLSRVVGRSNLLSFDVGGTSVDACVILDGSPTETYEAQIDDLPLQIPVFDIRTIGAGGGSIAWDDNGLLRVGPRSAGSVPGPVCYGAGGTEPTVTDAALILGYLDPARFLAGDMPLDVEGARAALVRVGEGLSMTTQELAANVFKVLMARTVGAVRELTVERGLDPADFALLAFGGAGPMFGPMLAREIGLGETLIPNTPAAFSAYGMIMSDVEYDLSETVLLPLDEEALATLERQFDGLEQAGNAMLENQDVPAPQREIVRRCDMRYSGQEHTIPVELRAGMTAGDLLEELSQLHEARYGHRIDASAEVVTVRVRAIGHMSKPRALELEPASGPIEPVETRTAYDMAADRPAEFAVYQRDHLRQGHRITGPAIVEEGTSTTVIFADQVLDVDPFGNLSIRSAA